MKTMTRKYVPCGACGKRCPKRKKDRWFANEGKPEFLVEVSRSGLCVDCERRVRAGVKNLRQHLMNCIEHREIEHAARLCLALTWLEREARRMEDFPVREGHIANIVEGDRLLRALTGGPF